MTTKREVARGALWRQWDLHVHTPASFHWQGQKFDGDLSSAQNTKLVDEMIEAMNKAEPAVFAIMDYWTFDGWLALRKRLRAEGAPVLKKLVLPGIELRLAAPMKGRLNAHVLFSNEVEDQVLLDFRSALRIELVDRSLSEAALRDLARQVGEDKLKHHGFKKAEVDASDDKALLAGAVIAEINADSYREAIRKVPNNQAIGFMPFDTSDGLAEVEWKEHYAYVMNLFQTSPIFETRDVDLRGAFVGEKTQGNTKYFNNFQAGLKKIPRLAVAGSDAHCFVGTPGNRVFTARAERDKRYGQYIENYEAPFESWRFTTLASAFAASLDLPERGLKKTLGDEYEEKIASFVLQNAGRVIQLARPDYSAVSSAAREMIDASRADPTVVMKLGRDGYSDMYFIGGQRSLFYSDKLKLIDGEYVAGEPLTSLWDDILSNNLHNEGGVEFPKGKKPEALIKRCFDLATKPGDIVLDSFAGSGTTGAVAHKMGRRWIMVELGEHCHTHVIPRLQSVVNGEDQGGISKAVGWQGGGGFRYYKLAPSLIVNDRWGNAVVNPEYNAAQLAEALAKLEGFTYAPSEVEWWQHGHSSERDFIYVTTQNLSAEQLQALSDEVGSDQSLLVCCAAYHGVQAAKASERWPNLTLKKIPKMVLARCEWGHDDYSLNVANLPMAQVEKAVPADSPAALKSKKSAPASAGQGGLFGGNE